MKFGRVFFKLKRLEYYGNFNNNGIYGDHDLVMVVVVCFHSIVGDDGGFGSGSNKGSELVVVAVSIMSLGGNIGTNGDNIGGNDTVT